MDVYQLKAGRPPSLLPFDSLLLPYPVTPAWRRQLAEAHSLRYVEAYTALGGPDELFIDVNRAGDSAHVRQQGFLVQATEEVTGALSDKSSGRVSLNIGFIGHDFDEHPTAHMIEGVFVWQRRQAAIKHDRMGVSEELETGRERSSRERPADYRTTPTAECCR